MLLNYWQAAKRVNRSVSTIKRWRRHGMVMGFNSDGARVVDERELLRFLREKLVNDPVRGVTRR